MRFFLIALLALPLFAQHGVRRPYAQAAGERAPFHPTIMYRGGPVMLGAPNVYILYYGDFSTGTSEELINNFFSSIGGSANFAVNTTYYDTKGYLTGLVGFNPAANAYNDKYSFGKKISSDAEAQKTIANAIAAGHLPVDPNGVYFFINSADVTVPNSFVCAYHSNSTTLVSGRNLKYAVVPLFPAGANLNGCDGNILTYGETNSPNDNLAADEAIDSIMHELSETVTDPYGNAWLTKFGNEVGDLCNFNYGTTFLAPNGTHANVVLGGTYYLIQTIWENKGAGFCANTLQ